MLMSRRKDWDEQFIRMSREEEELEWLFIMSYVQGLKVTLSTRGKMIGTPISKFNDTMMGRPNNAPQEFLSPYSLLFQRCSNKIFSGLFKPEVLFAKDPK